MRSVLIAMICIVIAVLAFSTLPLRSSGQDNTDERLAGLEARVSILETSLAGSETSLAEVGTVIPEENFYIAGQLSVTGDPSSLRFNEPGWECEGIGSFSDLKNGSAVTVTDGSGNLISTGRLENGTAIQPLQIVVCKWGFVVEVPRSDYYEILVSNRGSLTYSFAELETIGWKIDLKI